MSKQLAQGCQPMERWCDPGIKHVWYAMHVSASSNWMSHAATVTITVVLLPSMSLTLQ